MSIRQLLIMYGLDLVIVMLAVGAAVAAGPERASVPFPRRRLLLPGVLAFAGTLILLSYPDIRDLADPGVWLVGAAGTMAGGVRAWALAIEADHAHRLVRIRRVGDAVWIGWVMVLFAALQGAIETGLRTENPWEATAEFVMLLASGYLLGRSAVAWLRAGTTEHSDLLEA